MTPTPEALRAGGKPAMARALAQIERAPLAPETIALLDRCLVAPAGRTVGITGPPGVGKSSLLNVLIAGLRARDLAVGVIAVDPSSRRGGGALLGDRARLGGLDPSDARVFVRSMASRGRLGGLADLVFPALTLMQAVYDIVIIETVGVGQNETDVHEIVDLTVLCVQPSSGDSLQFLKSGIMEVPDMIVVTKSDLGQPAQRAASDLRLAFAATGDRDALEFLLCSSETGDGIELLVDRLVAPKAGEPREVGTLERRFTQAMFWCSESIRSRYGSEGLKRVQRLPFSKLNADRFAAHAALIRNFDNWMKTADDVGLDGGNV